MFLAQYSCDAVVSGHFLLTQVKRIHTQVSMKLWSIQLKPRVFASMDYFLFPPVLSSTTKKGPITKKEISHLSSTLESSEKDFTASYLL